MAIVAILIIAGLAYYIQYINKERKNQTNDPEMNIKYADNLSNKNEDNVSDNVSDNVTENQSDNKTPTLIIAQNDNISDNNSNNESKIKNNGQEKTDNLTKMNIDKETPPENEKKKKSDVKKKQKDNLNNVKIYFNDICWVHINIDNKKNLDFIAEKDSTTNIKFKDFFIIDIGNAAAVKITHGKEVYNRFGKYRQPVKHLKFTINEDNKLVYTKIK
jgi:hypothetical protein